MYMADIQSLTADMARKKERKKEDERRNHRMKI